MKKLALFAVIAAGLIAMPAMSQSEKTDKPGKKPEAAAAAKAQKADKKDGAAKPARTLPFNGKVSVVDNTAKTITLKELVLNVTADTKIIKAGKPATLADIPVGETITGKYTKDDAGKATAMAIRVGQKEDKPKTDHAPKKEESPKKDAAPKAEKASVKGK